MTSNMGVTFRPKTGSSEDELREILHHLILKICVILFQLGPKSHIKSDIKSDIKYDISVRKTSLSRE